MGDEAKCEICSKVSFLRCSFCRLVYYCSKEHQKKDWKRHKPSCTKRKFEICKNEAIGTRILSAEELKVDTIVFKDKPLMLGPKFGTSIEPTEGPEGALFCMGCYKELDSSSEEPECSHCGLPVCSESCAQEYWHKEFECRFFSEAKANVLGESEKKRSATPRN